MRRQAITYMTHGYVMAMMACWNVPQIFSEQSIVPHKLPERALISDSFNLE